MNFKNKESKCVCGVGILTLIFDVCVSVDEVIGWKEGEENMGKNRFWINTNHWELLESQKS